jgi:hypothetical protein
VGNKRPVSKMVSCDMKHKLVGTASVTLSGIHTYVPVTPPHSASIVSAGEKNLGGWWAFQQVIRSRKY